MSFRMYLAIMAVATLCSWGAWIFVMFNTNPEEASVMGFVLFYTTLFMGLIGTFTILGTSYRVFAIKRKEALFRDIRVSFRHALFMSTIAVGSIILSSRNVFRWWTIPLLAGSVCVIEYLILLREEGTRS